MVLDLHQIAVRGRSCKSQQRPGVNPRVPGDHAVSGARFKQDCWQRFHKPADSLRWIASLSMPMFGLWRRAASDNKGTAGTCKTWSNRAVHDERTGCLRGLGGRFGPEFDSYCRKSLLKRQRICMLLIISHLRIIRPIFPWKPRRNTLRFWL